MASYDRPLNILFPLISLRANKAYMLQTDSGKIPVYCQMTSEGIGACGGGGWTLVMKTDGSKVRHRQ